jgi:flagellar motility protein MotE (MotC chaperone)
VRGRLFAAVAVSAVAVAASYGYVGVPSAAAEGDALASASTGGKLAQYLATGSPKPEKKAAVSEGRLVTKTPWTTATVRTEIVLPPKGPWSTIVTGAIGNASPVLETGGVGETTPEARMPSGFQRVNEGAVAQAPAPESHAPAAAPATPAESTAPAPAAAAMQPKPLEALPPDATPLQQYCFNTADQAAEARFAWQAKKIKEMEAELAKRVVLLEEKTEEFKTWLARRDDFSKRAQEKLVAFYARMRPDAAALQLAAMEDETAAALLTKLEAKAASAVMAEMDPERAAKLAGIISGAARIPKPKKPKPPAEAGAQGKPQAENSPAPPAGAPASGGTSQPQGSRS